MAFTVVVETPVCEVEVPVALVISQQVVVVMPPATVEPVVVDIVAIVAGLGPCSLFSLSQAELL